MARSPELPAADISFRPLDPTDAAAVARIWNDTYADVHPADETVLERILASGYGDAELQWIAFADGEPIGFVWGRDDCPSWAKPGIGYLSAIAVLRRAQGRGVGTALHEAVKRELQRRGCHTLRLGADPDHLVPGVPVAAPPQTWTFFQRRGAVPGGVEFDLYLDLRPEVRQGLCGAWADVALPDGLAVAEDQELAMAFVARAFPGRWHDEAARFAALGVPLLALEDPSRSGDARAVGFAAVFPPDAPPVGPSLIWRRALSDNAAGMGPVGIAEDRRGRGVGLAFMAEACRWLRARGAHEVVIDWTTLTDFYGRLGARVWRAYQRAEAAVAEPSGRRR